MKTRILVVEDEQHIGQMIEADMNARFAVTVAGQWRKFIRKIMI